MLSWLSRTSWYYMEKLPNKVLELPFNGILEGVIGQKKIELRLIIGKKEGLKEKENSY